MDAVKNILSLMSTSSRIVVQIIYYLFHTFSTIGQYIVTSFSLGLSVLSSIFVSIYTLIQVLYEDFCIFCLDIVLKISQIVNFTSYFVNETSLALKCSVQTINRTLFVTYTFFESCVYSVYDLIMKIVYFILYIPELAKDVFIFMGSGIWLGFQIIPLSIVYIGTMTVYLIGRSFEEVQSMFFSATKSVLKICNDVYRFFSDIPIEAAFGIVIGICLLWTVIHFWRFFVSRLHNSIIYLYQHVINIPHFIWTKLEALVFWLVANDTHETLANENDDEDRDSDISGDSVIEGNVLQITLRRSNRTVGNSRKLNGIKSSIIQPDNYLCVVCQDQDKCVMILPCRHLCLCVECSNTIMRQNGMCPICRCLIRKALRAYL